MPGTGSRAVPTSSATSAARAGSAADRLASLVLRTGDLPSTWAQKPHLDSTATDDEQARRLTACVGGVDTLAHRIAKRSSADFTLGQAEISSNAALWRSPQDVADNLRTLTSPKTSDCYRRLVRESLQSHLNGTIDSVALMLRPGNGGGPADVVATLDATIVLTVNGRRTTVYLGAAFMRHAAVSASVAWQGVNQPVDSSATAAAVRAVADRVAAG